MEKKVVFRSTWLPWALLAPQVAVIAIFFFWPAAQALIQSFQQSDAFGTTVEWIGLENFRNLWEDESYLASFKTTAVKRGATHHTVGKIRQHKREADTQCCHQD